MRKLEVGTDGGDVGLDAVLGQVEPNLGEIQFVITLAQMEETSKTTTPSFVGREEALFCC